MCSEGASSYWNSPPRNYEHLLWIANNVQGLSAPTGSQIRLIAMLWQMVSDEEEKRKRSKKSIEALKDTIHELEIESLKQAWQWKNYDAPTFEELVAKNRKKKKTSK